MLRMESSDHAAALCAGLQALREDDTLCDLTLVTDSGVKVCVLYYNNFHNLISFSLSS